MGALRYALIMRLWMFSLLVVSLLTACDGWTSPRVQSPPSSGSRCTGAYNPPICIGAKRCMTDGDGCTVCTCDEVKQPQPPR